MFGRAERLVAWRYLRPIKGEGFVSLVAIFALVGIALGVGTLIVVLAVMNGFRAELLSRVLGVNGHASVVAGPAGIPDYDALVQGLQGAPGLVTVMPFVEGQVMVSSNGAASGALVRGVRLTDLEKLAFIAGNIQSGSLEPLAGDDSVAIGSRMAYRMGLSVGSTLTMISPKGAATAIGTVPRVKAFKVAAIFEIGMYEYDNSFIYMSLAEAQQYFQLPDRASGLELTVDDPERVAGYRIGLRERLPDGVQLIDWQQSNGQFFGAIQVERNVMFLILTLIIVVAAFNIITGLTMLVKSKSRDIAIMRTMGASRSAIMRIFFMSGAAIGVGGTVIGAILGLLFALNIETIRRWIEALSGLNLFPPEIRFLSELPAKVEPSDVVNIVTMALVLSLLATLYPSFRAARLDPVEALRHE